MLVEELENLLEEGQTVGVGQVQVGSVQDGLVDQAGRKHQLVVDEEVLQHVEVGSHLLDLQLGMVLGLGWQVGKALLGLQLVLHKVYQQLRVVGMHQLDFLQVGMVRELGFLQVGRGYQ